MPKPTGPETLKAKELIKALEKKGKIYSYLGKLLSKPRRSKNPVNVSKLEKMCKENENIIVPTKVLGMGEIKKPLNVFAFGFSPQARKKIEDAGGRCSDLFEVIEKNIKGKILV
jgi:large subunit ribosomal protein L18e